MPFIELNDGIPGIRSLVVYRPDTGKHLYDLAEIILRGESPLSSTERELIATYVSHLNGCIFCTRTHAAACTCLLGSDKETVNLVLTDYTKAPISEKLKCLLNIAGKVQADARTVSDLDVAKARDAGAVDRDIHDTVLIAATFCMFNRYVDGLNTFTPEADDKIYEEMGQRMSTIGYVLPTSNVKVEK
jgi:uncharacterized peroxidase-related enzyme